MKMICLCYFAKVTLVLLCLLCISEKQSLYVNAADIYSNIDEDSAKDDEGDQNGYQENKRGGATLMVPQSDRIQISISNADTKSDNGGIIHMDLLNLYKDVLREVIHMDKVKEVMRNVVTQLDGYQDLMSRVDRLESNNVVDEAASTKYGSTTHKTIQDDEPSKNDVNTNQWLDHLTFEGSDIYSDMSSENRYGNYVMQGTDNESVLRREVNRLTLKQTTLQRQITALEIALQQERIQGQSARVNLRKQSQEYEEARRILIEQASILEEQGLQLDIQQSTLNIQDAKLNQLVLQLQWKTGDIVDFSPEGSSKTVNLTEELILIKTSIQQANDDIKQISNRLDETDESRANTDGELKWMKIKVHNIRENMKKLLLLLAGYPNGSAMQPVLSLNQTAVKNILHSVETTRSEEAGDDSATALYNITRQLNVTQRRVLNKNKQQQKQIDDLSIDVENLKDEMDDGWNQLQILDSDFRKYRESSNEVIRERETLKRRLNRMMKDIRDLYETVETGTIVNRKDDSTDMKLDDSSSNKKGDNQPITEALVAENIDTQTQKYPQSSPTQISTKQLPSPPHQPKGASSYGSSHSNSTYFMLLLLFFVI